MPDTDTFHECQPHIDQRLIADASPRRTRRRSPWTHALKGLLAPALMVVCMAQGNAQARRPGADANAAPVTMPCIGGLCVADALHSLLDLPWQPVAAPRPSRTPLPAMDRITHSLRGDAAVVSTVLRYWPSRWFDGPALKALDSIDALCEDVGVWWRPRARLVRKDRPNLLVTFEPVLSATGAQAFRIATIFMQLPNAVQQPDASSRRAELEARFQGFPTYPTDDTPGVRWLTDAKGAVSLKLFAPVGDAQARASQLREQAKCQLPADVSNVPAASTPDAAAAASAPMAPTTSTMPTTPASDASNASLPPRPESGPSS
ncbi:MAG: hypothetical protein JWQ73_1751 [Variovorax sp.]|nr:hypothetical protein [Variovorax sp.]